MNHTSFVQRTSRLKPIAAKHECETISSAITSQTDRRIFYKIATFD